MKNTYSYTELYELTFNIFTYIGCSETDAHIIAEVLMAAELRGIPSHGLMRISDYISMWEQGRINVKPNIQIVYETPTTLTIDADNAYGMIAAKFAMQKVIEKAQTHYIAWGCVINSTHYGIAGYYALMATKNNMIGISGTNANPLVAPTWSVSRMLGTNPIAVAIPALSYPPFVADFASTPIARGKLALLEKEGKNIDFGFVQDKDGRPSQYPGILKEGGAIVPLGSDYEHGSHKGYCMAAIIDIFSSVLGGANFGPYVPPQVGYIKPNEKQVGKGLGHFFGAMRIDSFRPANDFLLSMDEWIKTFKNAAPDIEHNEVLVPGEPEFRHEQYNKQHGIKLNKEVYNDLIKITKKFGVPFE
ncbi:MAG: Ldh family oxidoreductase [Bacteroidales bacterium]|nr:Ldh family oxidoreductase [Bacteroidales bacterium]